MSEFKGTKGEPCSYSEMLNEIAKMEDTVPEKRVTYSSIEKARSGKKCNWVSFSKMIFSIKHQEGMGGFNR